MAVYELARITADVRCSLDENRTSRALLEVGDVDTLDLDKIICSKIEESVRRVHSDAPFHLLDGLLSFGRNVFWGDKQSGWVLLPDDFMRLGLFEMSDWERPAYGAIDVTDGDWVWQRSRYKGLRGTAQRPVCVISVSNEGRRLEFYSCRSEDAVVKRALYLPFPKVDKFSGVVISERCYEAVVYTVAALTSMALGEADKSNTFSELAKSILV